MTRANKVILNAHLKLAAQNSFPNKHFTVGSNQKEYRPYLHFTNSVDVIESKDEKIE